MANYRSLAAQAARRYGLDPNVFLRQINQESGFNPGARSKAGALGIAQFMPGTARGLGINPLDPRQALYGAAKLMAGYVKKFGSYRDALVAYNAGPGVVGHALPAETQGYIQTILGGRTPSTRGVSSSGGRGATPGQPGAVVSLGGRSTPDLSGANVAALLGALQQQQKPAAPSGSPLQGPAFSAQVALPSGYQSQSGGGAPAPAQSSLDVKSLLSMVQTPTGGATSTPGSTVAIAPTGGGAGSKVTGSTVTHLKGVAHFGGKPVAAWIAPILSYAKAHGWKGTVSSGYRSEAEQARIYNSGVRPAAKPGTSNHEFTAFPGGAVDVSGAQQLASILKRSPYANLLVWAGGKDPVHFSHPHNGGY